MPSKASHLRLRPSCCRAKSEFTTVTPGPMCSFPRACMHLLNCWSASVSCSSASVGPSVCSRPVLLPRSVPPSERLHGLNPHPSPESHSFAEWLFEKDQDRFSANSVHSIHHQAWRFFPVRFTEYMALSAVSMT